MSIHEKLKQVPDAPGVYFFYDQSGEIIYIGKAKVLKNRVRSYFQSVDKKDAKTQTLVKNAVDLEWMVVRDEVEALLTETNLIKEHRPRYNIFMKDDKTFPYIQITNEPYPRVSIVRIKNLKKDGHKYFGPYTDTRFLRETLNAIHKIFPLRTCDYTIDDEVIRKKKIKVCLDYHIKRCEGPCEGLVSHSKYGDMINRIERFIRGRNDDVKKYLSERMAMASENLLFEDAARYRDQLNAVIQFTRKQKKVSQDFTDRDILVVAAESTYGIGVVMRVRNGLFLGREKFNMKIHNAEATPENLAGFFKQYYSSTEDIPQEILLENIIPEKEELETWLGGRCNRRVKILTPVRGEKRKLVEICRRNADLLLGEIRLKKIKMREVISKPVQQLQEDLSLKVPPRRIEAFDNSNIQGSNPVASMVCFIDGKPYRSQYRRYHIKTVDGIDDFKSMHEVVSRRYSRQLREKKPLPDLILIDGGKGQLSAAWMVLQSMDLSYIPIVGLAKRLEEVFIPGVSDPQNIPKTSPGLFLLRQIRDEAHRFAVTFHRELRDKAMTRSGFTAIPGMGEKRVKKLWSEYKTVRAIASAGEDEIRRKIGIPIHTAREVIEIAGRMNSAREEK